MSNPFAINSYDAYGAYAKTMEAQNTNIGTGGFSGGAGSVGAAGFPAGSARVGKTEGINPFQQDINEVTKIGAQKRTGFEVGLGGTNNPDDHKIFYAA